MEQSLKGKNAVVTGSTSGIGEATAIALADAGANVVINGFGDAEAIEQLRQDLARRSGGKALYLGADMSKTEEIEGFFAKVVAELGSVDILVNNAGIQYTARVADFPAERWDAIIAINLSAVFHCTRLVLTGMSEKGWGRVINIASVHGLVASAEKAAYVAAKHGVMGLTKVTALETAKQGITCNAICPGFVLTPLVQKQVDDLAAKEGLSNDAAKVKLVGAKMPSESFVTPDQIGAMAVYLCSPAASSMTGVPLPLDGGWTAQ
jgi:3-hydroxybutyrate dehydrogenase|tara:strand:- start:5501 stop:6292 length:792 start_codon:yes stop_codon:yes gene_type:complete